MSKKTSIHPGVLIGGAVGTLMLLGMGAGGGSSDDFDYGETDDFPDPEDPGVPDEPTQEEALGAWGTRTNPGAVVVEDDHSRFIGNPHEGITLATSMKLARALREHARKVIVQLEPGQENFGIGSHTHQVVLNEMALRALSRGENVRKESSEAEGHTHEVFFGGAE